MKSKFLKQNWQGMLFGLIAGLLAGLVAVLFGYNTTFTIQTYGFIDTLKGSMSSIQFSQIKFIIFTGLIGAIIGTIADALLPEGWLKWKKKK